MTDDSGISVLDKLKEKFDVVNANPATKLYLNKLKSILSPIVIDSLKQQYEEIESNHENTNTLKSFQINMKEVPKWNQIRIDEECNKIKEKCDWIHDLITGVFVVCVKIMTSVKISNQEKDYELVTPDLSKFIHLLYSKCAKDLFHNPYLMRRDHDQERNLKKSNKFKKLVRAAIDDTVNDMLPTQEILQQYIYAEPDQALDSVETTENNADAGETFAAGDNSGKEDDNDPFDEPDNTDEEEEVDEEDGEEKKVVDMNPHRKAEPNGYTDLANQDYQPNNHISMNNNNDTNNGSDNDRDEHHRRKDDGDVVFSDLDD